MSQPVYAKGYKDLPGGRVWIDRNGMPASVESTNAELYRTSAVCIRCLNYCIHFQLTEWGPICSACEE